MQLIVALVDELDSVAISRIRSPMEARHTFVVGEPQVRPLFDDCLKQLNHFKLSRLHAGEVHRHSADEMHNGLVLVRDAYIDAKHSYVCHYSLDI